MEAARAGQIGGPWAARIAVAEAPAAAVLRLRTDVQAAIVGDVLWLRGGRVDAELDRLLDFIAPHGRYEVDASAHLRLAGHRLPVDALPTAAWRPVAEVFAVGWPAATPASALPQGVALRLIRSDREQPANALLVDLAAFEAWASQAAGIRLSPLRFAATTEHALVLGQPVPPIAGLRLYESNGIIAPCGWQIMPAIDPPSLRQLLNLRPEDMALFDEAGWTVIAADSVTGVTRSAARLTLQEVRRG
jgi:hypothetical protein